MDTILSFRAVSRDFYTRGRVVHAVGETLALLRGLSSAQWERGGIHPARGRLPMTAWVASLAAHDDNHLDQLLRALAGRP